MTTPLILELTIEDEGVAPPSPQNETESARVIDLFTKSSTDETTNAFIVDHWKLVAKIHEVVITPMLLGRVIPTKVVNLVMNCITATILYNLALTINPSGVDIERLKSTLELHFKKLETKNEDIALKLSDDKFFVNVRIAVLSFLNKENL